MQSERKPNSYLGSGEQQDKEESSPISINPLIGFESSKTPVVGKDIPSQPPTNLVELHFRMAKAFEGAFNVEPKELGKLKVYPIYCMLGKMEVYAIYSFFYM